MARFNVALDGPSGAGKSSVANAVAAAYGLVHLDTGAMYRAIAMTLAQRGIAPQESEALVEALASIDLQMDKDRVLVDGQDVSGSIRTPEVSRLASTYSALPSVRKRLVELQQAIASHGGYILDGRDICDVVLPNAQVKIYLDASPKARAQRRMLQLAASGRREPFEKIYQEIEERDFRDRNRETDPLRISKQAVVIDSSDLSEQQTIDAVKALIDQTVKEPSL